MSRFVSEGSKEDNAAESNDAWTKAKQEVKALKQPKQPPGSGLQEGGISLYETLQANKEKKQAEFEESQRLKNQFQALNEDDADFLDSVLESTRAKEAAVRKETAEQLDDFRRQREAAEKETAETEARVRARNDEQAASISSGDSWTKKRRRKDPDAGAMSKLRKTSTAQNSMPSELSPVLEDAKITKATARAIPPERDSEQPSSPPSTVQKVVTSAPPSGLGLVAYDSDDD